MSISWFGGVFGLGKDEMAKAPKAVADEGRVSECVGRLTEAKTDRPTFEAVLSELQSSKELTSADLIAVAHRYNKGGKKPGSKAAALAMIKKRFIEIVRTANKNKVAERARPW
jgi:hypothetical protein